jgi:hypothetical protein
MDTKELEIFSQLCDIIEESEQMSLKTIDYLDEILSKLNELRSNKNIQGKIDEIINTVTTIISSMQSQDFHIQKIQRVANLINPDNDKFARAKHIVGDKHNNLVSDDELEALIALHNT